MQLKKSDGFVTTDGVEMRHIVADYYESLLSTENIEVLQIRQKVWIATSVKVISDVASTSPSIFLL